MSAQRWRTVAGTATGKLAAASVLVLALAGCGGETAEQVPEPSGETSTTSSSSTSSSSTSSSSATSVPTDPTTVPPRAGREGVPETSAAATAPTLVECIYGGGSWTSQGLMSDGSYAEHPTCAALREEQLAKYPYVCPHTDHHVADLSQCLYPSGLPSSSERPSPSAETSALSSTVEQRSKSPSASSTSAAAGE